MHYLNSAEITSLEKKANMIRQSIIEMLSEAGSGHTAGPLGMADIFTLLYFGVLKHDPENPDWEERDRVVLSNGHICPVLYATLAHAGYFPNEDNNPKFYTGDIGSLNKEGFRKIVKNNKFKVFDMRNIYSPTKMKKLRIDYFGIGR